MKRARQMLVASLAFGAWLAISNHCAVASLTAPSPSQSEECLMHSASQKKKLPSSNVPCCKILRATIAKTAPNFARAIVDLAQIDFSFAEFIRVAPAKISFVAEARDTGPPGKTAFAELTSSSSLRAPPAKS